MVQCTKHTSSGTETDFFNLGTQQIRYTQKKEKIHVNTKKTQKINIIIIIIIIVTTSDRSKKKKKINQC